MMLSRDYLRYGCAPVIDGLSRLIAPVDLAHLYLDSAANVSSYGVCLVSRAQIYRRCAIVSKLSLLSRLSRDGVSFKKNRRGIGL